MLWDHRPGQNRFAGIVLQEYSAAERALVGERQLIFEGTALGFTEAPHLYKRNGYYYLITAEGGTGWGHAVTMARSRSLLGPYELHPDTYILTARDRPDAELQRAGHADLVETPGGETYMVYLCGRPLRNRGRCTLGRETAIQRMTWSDDGWLRTRLTGEGVPSMDVPAPALAAAPVSDPDRVREDFDGPAAADRFSVAALAVAGRALQPDGAPGTSASLWPRDDRQPVPPGTRRAPAAVALLQRRDRGRLRAAAFPADGGARLLLQQREVPLPLHLARRGRRQAPAGDDVPARPGAVGRRSRRRLPFRAAVACTCGSKSTTSGSTSPIRSRAATGSWLPQQFDASILSDEATAPGLPNFTGAFVGMACQDLAGTAMPADFDYFEYQERGYRPNPFLESRATA